MLWASNWPHVSVSAPPDDAMLLDVLLDWAPDEAVGRMILAETRRRSTASDPEARSRAATPQSGTTRTAPLAALVVSAA